MNWKNILPEYEACFEQERGKLVRHQNLDCLEVHLDVLRNDIEYQIRCCFYEVESLHVETIDYSKTIFDNKDGVLYQLDNTYLLILGSYHSICLQATRFEILEMES